MASEHELRSVVKDSFVVFKPKDVVSGDFYRANLHNDHFYLAVCDSTGHGIPGAFMSLLNISLLNEGLLSKGLVATSDLFGFVRKILILGLKQDESGQGGNDGMDGILIRIDLRNMALQYTGANNPLRILRNGSMIELPPDKMPVGRSPKQELEFTAKDFFLQKGDQIYMFTDGYADQFGGPKGKKFKYKQLEELLINNSLLSMHEQKQLILDSYMNWKGDLEQVDDICVIGLRL